MCDNYTIRGTTEGVWSRGDGVERSPLLFPVPCFLPVPWNNIAAPNCAPSPSVPPRPRRHFTPLHFSLCRAASASSFIHSEEPPEQSREICSESRKVTLGNDRGTKMERKREWGNHRGGGISLGVGGITLALGHLLTNNRTALHRCRKPAGGPKRGGERFALGFLHWPGGVSQYYTLDTHSHLALSLKEQQIFIASCATHLTPSTDSSIDTAPIWTNALPTNGSVKKQTKQPQVCQSDWRWWIWWEGARG